MVGVTLPPTLQAFSRGMVIGISGSATVAGGTGYAQAVGVAIVSKDARGSPWRPGRRRPGAGHLADPADGCRRAWRVRCCPRGGNAYHVVRVQGAEAPA